MTKPREGLYVWVTWLSRLIVGEIGCQWATWFKTHYTGYAKAPSDFELAGWTAEHTQLLDELSRERSSLGEGVYIEDQNRFRVRRSSKLVIGGKPDLITVDKAGHVTIYDTKTGNPRQSDIIQVMLYMLCLPYASPLYKGKEPDGCVVYKSGARSKVPAKAIDEAFRNSVTYFLNILQSENPPGRAPGPNECRFCDISVADCQDKKVAGGTNGGQEQEPEIPL